MEIIFNNHIQNLVPYIDNIYDYNVYNLLDTSIHKDIQNYNDLIYIDFGEFNELSDDTLKYIIKLIRNYDLNNIKFKVKGVPLREKVEIRLVPDRKGGIAELRFWYIGKLVDKHLMKNN